MSNIIAYISKHKKIIYIGLFIVLLPLITLLTQITFDAGRIIGTIIRTYIEQGICWNKVGRPYFCRILSNYSWNAYF